MALLHSFRWRLLLLVGALVIVSQAATFAGALTVLERDVRAGTARELDAAAELAEAWIAQRAELLGNGADVLVADFGFRTAIASGDRETIVSSLENNAARIGADIAVLYAPDGRPLVASDGATTAWDGTPARLAGNDPDARVEALMPLGGAAWQTVVVPVKAPLTIGRLLFGFALDRSVTAELARQSGMQVSIGTRENASWRHRVTVRDGAAALLDESVLNALPASGAAGLVTLGGVPFMVRTVVPEVGGGAVRVVLQRSLAEALAPYYALRARLVATTGAALLCGLLAAAWMAHGVSRPLARLTEAARRVVDGNYDAPTGIERNDEIGALADTFDTMRAAVAEREAHITRLASHDEATGLVNRRVLLDRLAPCLARGASPDVPIVLLIIGVDALERTVDTLGHRVGETLVRAIADRLQRWAGNGDTVARVGDDAFAVLVHGVAASDIDGLMAAAATATAQPLAIGEAVLAPSVSVGAALVPDRRGDRPDGAEDLLRHAGIALADARDRGFPTLVYEPGRDEQLRRQLSIVADLKRAVAGDELVLHYQPKVRCTDAEVVGVEALVRWIHPEHGFMPPDEFIRLAESSGNVSLLSDWVIDRAVRQAAEWHARGRALSVSVNLSALDLRDASLPERIRRCLERNALPPERLVVEITESAVVEDEALALGILRALRELGVRVSIDDFGTGQSSLAKLRHMPADELKIDRAFVTDIVAGSPDAMIVRAIVELGHGLGLSIVTEGIETADEFAVLSALGTDSVQGYFHSKPLPAPALVEWLDARESVARAA